MSCRSSSLSVFGLILTLCIVSCKRDEGDPLVSTSTSAPDEADTSKQERTEKEPKPIQHHGDRKARWPRKSRQSTDTALTILLPPDTSTAMSQSEISDSSSVKRFYLLQSLANSLQTPATTIERPPMHPDSMTWEDIAGIPKPHKEQPWWIKALGYVRVAAIILGFTYLIFFDK